jgi:hypothetical protein
MKNYVKSIVDEFPVEMTGVTKTDLKNKMFTLFTDLNVAAIDVKFIRCDDSVENKSFYDSRQANGLNIKFEFSGPRTLQRNDKVEQKF